MKYPVKHPVIYSAKYREVVMSSKACETPCENMCGNTNKSLLSLIKIERESTLQLTLKLQEINRGLHYYFNR